MVTLRVTDGRDRLQHAKKGRVKTIHAPRYAPVVEGAQPGKVVALISRVHPVGEESSRQTFGQMSPVEQGLPLRSEPSLKPQEHSEIVSHSSCFLPGESIGQVELHAVPCSGR